MVLIIIVQSCFYSVVVIQGTLYCTLSTFFCYYHYYLFFFSCGVWFYYYYYYLLCTTIKFISSWRRINACRTGRVPPLSGRRIGHMLLQRGCKSEREHSWLVCGGQPLRYPFWPSLYAPVRRCQWPRRRALQFLRLLAGLDNRTFLNFGRWIYFSWWRTKWGLVSYSKKIDTCLDLFGPYSNMLSLK